MEVRVCVFVCALAVHMCSPSPATLPALPAGSNNAPPSALLHCRVLLLCSCCAKQLVFQYVEKQLTAQDDTTTEHAATSSNISSRSQRLHQLQQQHAKLQEELMLRSAAADYPSYPAHSLGPSPANVLSVLIWPGQDLILTGAADGTVRLLRFGAAADSEQNAAAGGSTGGSSSEVWATALAGAGGVLTLALHPNLPPHRCVLCVCGAVGGTLVGRYSKQCTRFSVCCLTPCWSYCALSYVTCRAVLRCAAALLYTSKENPSLQVASPVCC
jgi:hypothetical protein